MNCGQTTTPCHICKTQSQCSHCPGRGTLYNIVACKLNKHDAPLAGCVGMCCGILVCEVKLLSKIVHSVLVSLLPPLVICFCASLSFTWLHAVTCQQESAVVFRYKILKNFAHFECSAAILVFRSIRKIKVFRTQLDCSIAIELQQELKIART